MSLAYEALRFIDRIRRNPADGSDPRLLDRLEKYAKEAFEGIVALHAPASPMTWETVSLLRGSTISGPRQPFRFPRPVEIVGFMPTVLPILPASGGGVIPTTDSIAVQIDTDNQNYMTSGDGISTNAGGTAGPFVTLTTLGVQIPRVVGYKLRNPTPDIGFTFRWRIDPTGAGGPFFRDVLIGMTIYARYL
jgi:hypothetical protein